ncbi:hypothetical protein Q5530_27460 [Saccharothrix sp. BKS2]|uniref:hypothetical protein n=1 Tax=Saccharothrix sp. BKS2 TaxID=3064400 RepID=UPI0039EB2652
MGSDPVPRRCGPTWREFLTAQAETITAADLLHLDTVIDRRLHAPAFLEPAPGACMSAPWQRIGSRW